MRVAVAAAIGMLFGCSTRSTQLVDRPSSAYVPPSDIAVSVTRVERVDGMRQVYVAIRSSPSAPPVEYTGQFQEAWLENQVLREGVWVTTTYHPCGAGVEQRTLLPGGMLVEQDNQWLSEGSPIRLGFAYRLTGSEDVRVAWSVPIK